MDFKIERLLDQIGVKILHELQKNARMPFSKIGRRVGLSSPAVTERVKKMEDTGIICGYHVKIDHKKIGCPIIAFIFLTTQPEKYNKIYRFAENSSEIFECHCISGSESFILRTFSNSISQLDDLVEKLGKFGETKTSIVLSSPIKKEERYDYHGAFR
jgi:Lrp/AsnC family transcriptional regulator, leucine-responsive regulatory protein